ncbi:MAG: hypothetical protein R3E32_22545 [Chitinophagales bacterium]
MKCKGKFVGLNQYKMIAVESKHTCIGWLQIIATYKKYLVKGIEEYLDVWAKM